MKKLIFLLFICSSQLINGQEISSNLAKEMLSQNHHDIIIKFSGNITFDAIDNSLTKAEKSQFVYDGLLKQAEINQYETKSYLRRQNVDYSSFIINNIIHAKVSNEQIYDILTLPYVEKILLNPTFYNSFDPGIEQSDMSKFRAEYTWGLENLSIPEIWEKGFKGEGIVIAGQDTGYEWDHPALQGSYKGSGGNHSYTWHDAIKEPLQNSGNDCGYNLIEPCDDHGHGTHTAGTFAGQEVDGFPIFGIAPKAKWIGCRNMDEGFGTPTTYSECLEWFLAPTDINGENPDVALAPDIINNSWGCTPSEGCTLEHINILKYAVDNLRNAGILVVVSAGNSGRNGCSSVENPIAIYESSFTVGAYAENEHLASFSSRGPVTVDSSFRLKPDIVGPGVNVFSASRNQSYRSSSGTSMSGPHIAGLAALILSANPALKGNVDSLENLIKMNARPIIVDTFCNVDSIYPNNMYGYGKPLSLDIIELFTVSTNEKIAERIAVYPNPAQDYVIFNLPNSSKELKLRIYDLNGVLIKQIKIDSQIRKYHLSTTQYSEGLYFFSIDDTNMYQGKFVIY